MSVSIWNVVPSGTAPGGPSRGTAGLARWRIFPAVLIAVGGCASAPHRAAHEEVSPQFADRSYQSLLVVGVYDDRAFRVSAESAFVEELRSRGIEATSSFAATPDLDSFDDRYTRTVLTDGGYDGLLAVATLDEGYDYDYEDYLETRGLVYLLGGQPGAGTDMGAFVSWAGSGAYSLLVTLWDADTLEPVWQVTTESQSTGSESGDARALADFVVETLRTKGFLPSTTRE